MSFKITARVEIWPVAGEFIISRGSKDHVDVVFVEIEDGDHVGRGEGTPIYYKGETAEGCVAAIQALPARFDRQALQALLPAGAARNAVDCGLWDLEAKQQGTSLAALLGMAAPVPTVSAFTISLGTPGKMEADARSNAHLPLLKLKLAGEGDRERVAAVRCGAPRARIIVDANEAWTGREVIAEAEALAAFGVEMIEQPVKAGEDHLLDGITSPIPFVADESCQTSADLDRLIGRYAGINIKLDKAGGLTETLHLAEKARALGLDIMVGCMLGTSRAIHPAFPLVSLSRWVDLDGPLLLARDRPGGAKLIDGLLHPPVLG